MMTDFKKFTKLLEKDFAILLEKNRYKYKKGDKLLCKKDFKILPLPIIQPQLVDINFIKNKVYIIEEIYCGNNQFVIRVKGEFEAHQFSVDPNDAYIERRKLITDYFFTMKEARKLKLRKLMPFYKRIFKQK